MNKTEFQGSPLSPVARTAIIKAVQKRVHKSYVNVAGVDLDDWTTQLNDMAARLGSTDVDAFEDAIREHLKQLRCSHTGFYHGVEARFLPQHSINATVKSVGSNGRRQWMFLDVFPEGPADRVGIRPGEILGAIDGVPSLPPAMPSLKTGQNYKLLLSGREGQREITISVPYRKGTKQRPPIVEPKAVTWCVVDEKIGVLRIPYFSGAAGMQFGAELGAAVAELTTAGIDRLIIDLRGNIGGSLGFSMLASYLCPDKRPIGYSITPAAARRGVDKEKLPRVPMPRNKISLLLTLGEFAFRDKSVILLTQGLGPQPFHGRVVMLVNEWTNSAAEMVASFAKENGLATLVGTKTAGNVLGAANFAVGKGYWLRVPVFGWMTWAGKCLEGNGITPDMTVEADAESLSCGVDPQMKNAVDIISTM